MVITVVEKRSLHAQEMFHCYEMSTSHASCCCVSWNCFYCRCSKSCAKIFTFKNNRLNTPNTMPSPLLFQKWYLLRSNCISVMSFDNFGFIFFIQWSVCTDYQTSFRVHPGRVIYSFEKGCRQTGKVLRHMLRLIFLELYIGEQFYIQFLLACIYILFIFYLIFNF